MRVRFTFTFVENKQLHKSDKPVNYSYTEILSPFNSKYFVNIPLILIKIPYNLHFFVFLVI